MTEILEIKMTMSAATGRVINRINFIDNYDKVANILKSAVDYKYDDAKSLADNVIAYYTQRGYPKFSYICDRFKKTMDDWLKDGPLLGIDVGKTAEAMAVINDIPLSLDVEIK